MCSRVMISKIAQLHIQTYKLISVYAPYFPSSLRTHPLSHPLFAFSFLLRSPSSLAQQQLVVCSNRLRSSPFSLSLCTVSLSSLHTRTRHWCSADPPTCTCMICEWQVLKKKVQHRSVYKCAWECFSEASFCAEEHVCGPRDSVRMHVWQVLSWSVEFLVYYRCVVCLPPSPPIWLSCEDKKHPAGMSTSPGANDGSQRNSCKWLYFIFSIWG